MAHSMHPEVERSYDVEPEQRLPDLLGTGGVKALGPTREFDLTAEYYDTADLDLARLRISVRRREGGHDAGWHLKVPAGGAERIEVHFPAGSAGDPVPTDLLALVRGAARDRPVAAVARLDSHRVERPLLDEGGHALALLCDDVVTAQRHGQDAGTLRWREWEVELADDGDEDLLDDLGDVLVAAGGAPSPSRSKIRRALGFNGQHGQRERPLSEASAGQALSEYLALQRDRLLVHDVGVRLGSPVSVHHLRTSTRRLRSALATYRSLLEDSAAVQELRAELKWLGDILAPSRDATVLREHLDAVLQSQPAELVLGPVRTRVDDQLAADYREGLARAVDLLGTPRYFALVGALDRLVESPAYTPLAEGRASEVVPGLLAREVKRLRRAHRAVGSAASGPDRDERWHEVRKKAKRLRYAADSARPALGYPAKRLSRRAKRMQEALGERQDAVVARERLRELGVQAHLSGENGFTFGLMHALEGVRIQEAEAAFQRAWKRLPRHGVRAWLSRG